MTDDEDLDAGGGHDVDDVDLGIGDVDLDALDDKHERNRERRLDAVVRWAEYVRENPPEVWGPQQNAVVESQLESAQATGLDADHHRRVRKLAEELAGDSDFSSDE